MGKHGHSIRGVRRRLEGSGGVWQSVGRWAETVTGWWSNGAVGRCGGGAVGLVLSVLVDTRTINISGHGITLRIVSVRLHHGNREHVVSALLRARYRGALSVLRW